MSEAASSNAKFPGLCIPENGVGLGGSRPALAGDGHGARAGLIRPWMRPVATVKKR